MRRRLLVIMLSLVFGLLLALGGPLARALAARISQDHFIARTDDASWFVDIAEPALASGRTGRLTSAITRYDQLYDTPVFVTDADRRIITSSRDGLDLSLPDRQRAVGRALAGQPPEAPQNLWPWDSGPRVVAEPIVRDGRVLGAVVLEAPTDNARARVGYWLVIVGVGGLVALAVVAGIVVAPVVRWVLRPVHDLDEAAHAVAAGDLGTQVSEQAGPPELRRLAHNFNLMAASVAAALDQQRAFVAQASHQMRNPLTALRLRMETATTYMDDPAPKEELRLALEETDRLRETLDGMLALARAEASRAERRPVAMLAEVTARVDAWRAAYAARRTPLRIDASANPAVHCPADVLHHALDALLDNALKFADGSPVCVGVVDDGDHVEVVVQDGGPGLSPAEIDQATARFWRSPRHQNVPGTGLGLAITSTLAESCGGSLALRAREPQGLEVRLRLPVGRPA